MEATGVKVYFVIFFAINVQTSLISTKFDLCGPMNEISLDFLDESSVTIALVSDEYAKYCKMKIVAPETHVIYLNVIENIPSGIQRDVLRAPKTTCQLKVYQNESSNPVWSGDPCSAHILSDIDLLDPEITLEWSPPMDPSHTRGRKLLVTAVGRGDVCKDSLQHTCMSIGHEPLFCISKYLLCDGNRNCPKGATRNDEDDKICKIWNLLFRELKKPVVDNKLLNFLMSQTTKSPKARPHWQDWTYIQRVDVTTLRSTTTETTPSNIESLSVALSHYGPWGYILLGMLICGTVLMFCGVWECFRKPKPTSPPSEGMQTSPTTILIIDPPETTDPPRYDDIDPPAYSVLFPVLKDDPVGVGDTPGSSSIDARQHSEIEAQDVSNIHHNNSNNSAQTQAGGVGASTNVDTETERLDCIHRHHYNTGCTFICMEKLHLNIRIDKEDNNGFVALCYGFSAVVSKQLPVPNTVVQKLLTHMQSKKFSIYEYFQKRLEMIINPSNLSQNNGQPISGILLHIFTYAIRFLQNGMLILLDLGIFQKIQLAIQKNSSNTDRLRTVLSILLELVVYTDSCQNPVVDELRLSDTFDASGCSDICLEIMKKYENNKNIIWLTPISFKVIMQVCLVKGRCQEWLQNNYEDLQPFYEQARTVFFQNKTSDERTYDKMKKFEVLMNLLISGEKICKKIIYRNVVTSQRNISEKVKEECLLDGKINSRKAKRRTKALKAKIVKFKAAELTERLNNSSRKITDSRESEDFSSKNKIESQGFYEQIPDFDDPNENITSIEEDVCDIVNSIKKNLLIGLELESELLFEKTEQKISYARLDWKNKIMSMPFNVKPKIHVNCVDSYEEDFYLKPDDLNIFNSETSNISELRGESLEALLYPSVRYLNVLLNKIINKYQKYWMIDYQLEKEVENNTNDNKVKPEECIEQTKILQKLEKEKIEILRHEFKDIILFIKETAAKDLQQSRLIIKKVENVLLSHEIRGTTIISEVCPTETVYVSITMPENVELPNPNGAKNTLIQYMEDVLNDRQEPIENINIAVTEPQIKAKTKNYMSDDILYTKEVAVLSKTKPIDTKCTLEAQKRTLKHAYHMQTSILNVCEETDEERNEKSKDLNFDYKKISKTMMFFNKNVYPNRPELIFTDTFVDPLKKSENEGETSRWCTLVRSLEMMEDCQQFLNGTVRISCKEKRQSHVISTGGNFTPVELGLDSCNRPLAVKRIPKGSCVCEMIRTMLVDLLDLRHKNLLHYFACDYDTNELIIATPLCEYNVGQYLMLMKQNQTNLSALDVVKQFLTGLLFLHDGVNPIVHGNLKPSNIFIDMNGVVKIAEFGIHRALFKFKEAPNSSIIWFATETYRTFKQLSVMECTYASDIQVAGMLVHFLMTAGKHPYGDDMRIILKNLDKAVPQLSASDLELQDLITWMLLYEPIERPTIQQVVTHVYFWSSERKWKFILTCAGLGNRGGTPVFKLEDLHVCLDNVASKDNIKGKWVQVVKKQFPKICFSNNDDTPTGLLKFIKTCMENKDSLCFHQDLNLSSYILTSFPAFALSLYRMLENSVWVKHSTFANFYSIENICT
ncbi:hypothetical protein Trydic_g10971 [Trypoxylus dichotomus]